MNKVPFLIALATCCALSFKAQTNDSLKVLNFNEVIIKDESNLGGTDKLSDLKDNVIYAGKKNDIILLSKINVIVKSLTVLFCADAKIGRNL